MYADDKELFAALVLAIISRMKPMRKFKGIYFYINNSRVEKTQDYGNDLDNERYDLGNYFLFSDDAKQVLESKEYRDFWAKVRENKIENNKHSKNGCRHEKATLAGTIYPFTSKKEDELKVICADCGVVLDDDPRKYMIEKGLWKIK